MIAASVAIMNIVEGAGDGMDNNLLDEPVNIGPAAWVG
jgi:hypothetical protein